MEYNFEEFESTGKRFNLSISLGDSQRFYLGGAFCKKYDILMNQAVKLMYDKEKKAVGFRFSWSKEDGTVAVQKLGKDSAYINAKAFLGTYNLDATKYSGRYQPKEINDPRGTIFVIELKEKPDFGDF